MYSPTRKTVADIKQAFEPKSSLAISSSSPPTRPGSPTRPATPSLIANMPPPKALTQLQQAVQPSVDAVLNAASRVVPETIKRPSASKQPSWIGPKPAARSPTPSASSVMKTAVTINFSAPDLQPPVFVSTSLSDPQWVPTEMEAVKNDRGEWLFSKCFQAEEGEYQYKLRLGPGEWWICDDSKPKVDDGAGNENNLLIVKDTTAPESKPGISSELKPEMDPVVQATNTDTALPPSTSSLPEIHEPEKESQHERDDPGHLAPLMKHESLEASKQGLVGKSMPPMPFAGPDSPRPAPGLHHESLAPPLIIEDDNDNVPESPPLLRHESVAPEQSSHSPLFHHESTSIDDKRHQDILLPASELIQNSGHAPPEADENDARVEKFPTDHEAIMEHIDRSCLEIDASEWRITPITPPMTPKAENVAVVEEIMVIEAPSNAKEDSPAPDTKHAKAPRILKRTREAGISAASIIIAVTLALLSTGLALFYSQHNDNIAAI